MEKILSVSIAAYNVERTLEEALKPFTAPKIADAVDVMIIDDGSADRTAEIAKRYEEQYPGTFRLISKENGGWGSTLNTGFEYACGKYFKQLDGDDYYSYENLSSFLDFLKQTEADLIYSPFVTFTDETGGILRVLGGLEGDYRYFKTCGTVDLADCPQLIPAMHSLTVRTDLLKKSGIQITEHCFYTDVEFVLKAYNNSRTVAFFEKPVYYYRLARSGQSMGLSGVRKHYRDHLKMLMTMLEYEQNSVTEPTKKKVFRQRLGDVCNMQYVFFFALKHTKEHKKELQAFDRKLKEEYPEFYAMPQGHLIGIGRKLNFTPYSLIASAKIRKDRRERKSIFEGEN